MATEIGASLVEILTVLPDPRTPIDAVSSALEAAARYVLDRTRPAVARAFRGWPEHQADLDLSSGPVVTIVASNVEDTACSPAFLEGTVIVRTGYLKITAQLDLWAPYRHQLDVAARAVQEALDAGAPWQAGADVVSEGYHDRPVHIERDSGRYLDLDRAAAEGEWRRSWTLILTTDTVLDTGLPTQDEVTLVATVDGLEEPDELIA